MRFSKYVVLLTILIATAPVLHAQGPVGKHTVTAGWGVNIPLGDKQFLNKTNLVAPAIGYEYAFSDSFSLGLTVGYGYSREKGETTDRYDGDPVGPAHTDRKLTLIPIQAQFRYYIFNDGVNRLVPFISVAGGIQYADYYITGDAINTTERQNWSYVVNPGIGLRIIPGESGRFCLDVTAGWRYGGNDFPVLDIKSQQYVNIQLAAGFRF